MAKKNSNYRPKVPPEIKRRLYREAGNKCANPGCPAQMVELHHIREWHVYQTHNAKHMIAICPTCHGYAHHSDIRIDEATIRSWKKAKRNPSNTGYLYIEPGPPPRILMGCIYWVRKNGDGAVILRLSDKNEISFRIIPGNILLVSLKVSDPDGRTVVELRENHLKHALREGVELDSRPGRLRVTVPATEEFAPQAMIGRYPANDLNVQLVTEGRISLIDLQVLDIGTVQIEGCWIEGERAIIINGDHLSICTPSIGGFCHFRGYGEVRGDKDLGNLPTFYFEGAIETSMLEALFKDRLL